MKLAVPIGALAFFVVFYVVVYLQATLVRSFGRQVERCVPGLTRRIDECRLYRLLYDARGEGRRGGGITSHSAMLS